MSLLTFFPSHPQIWSSNLIIWNITYGLKEHEMENLQFTHLNWDAYLILVYLICGWIKSSNIGPPGFLSTRSNKGNRLFECAPAFIHAPKREVFWLLNFWPQEVAKKMGEAVATAKSCLEKGVTKVAFDRGGQGLPSPKANKAIALSLTISKGLKKMAQNPSNP